MTLPELLRGAQIRKWFSAACGALGQQLRLLFPGATYLFTRGLLPVLIITMIIAGWSNAISVVTFSAAVASSLLLWLVVYLDRWRASRLYIIFLAYLLAGVAFAGPYWRAQANHVERIAGYLSIAADTHEASYSNTEEHREAVLGVLALARDQSPPIRFQETVDDPVTRAVRGCLRGHRRSLVVGLFDDIQNSDVRQRTTLHAQAADTLRRDASVLVGYQRYFPMYGLSLYFSFSTLTTLGLGDGLPANGPMRLLVILETISGLSIIVFLIAHIGSGPEFDKSAQMGRFTFPRLLVAACNLCVIMYLVRGTAG